MKTSPAPCLALWAAVCTAILCGNLAAIAQTQAPKKPPPVPPPLPPMPYALEDAFGGLTFSQPLAIVSAPGETNRIFVVEKTGCIQAVTQLDQPTPAKHVFANLTERPDGKLDDKGECGVLGLAFHPDFVRNGRFFVYYSLRIGGQLHERVSRFRVSPNDPQQADIASEQPLITQLDPANNHNGGDLHFGPDGYLYISAGDGGGANDAFNTARFINKDFHAAILRIDVDKRPGSLPPNPYPAIARDESGAAHYAVPTDNPFIGATEHHGETIDPPTVRTEIWATGLRNPWRFCFDPPTGRLFAGDVGQNLYEEVNLIIKGGDYGWSHREGLHAFDLGPGKDQPPAEFHPIDPIFEYPRTTGISITGGRVCRGSKFPELSGAYLFADYGFGRIIALREKDAKWEHEIIAVENGIAGIGADPRDGELLFANLGKGSVMRLKRSQAIENSLGLKLVRIPASEFTMGSPTTEKGRREDEPQRRVRLTRDYFIGQFEVTRGQFRKFVEATGYKTDAERGIRGGYGFDEATQRLSGPDHKYSWRFTGFAQTDEHPVVNVSWNDAGAFCRWLTEQEKQTYRLPTEAEWEHACRGGTATAYCNGDNAEKIVEVGNIMDSLAHEKFTDRIAIAGRDGFTFTAPVGTFRPNALGLHDMHGNVWEWTADWFGPPTSTPQTDPRGPADGKDKVVRGGDWYHDWSFARSAQRYPIRRSAAATPAFA